LEGLVLTENLQEEWKKTTLAGLIEVQNGYAFKSEEFSLAKGIPVIKIKNIASGELTLHGLQYYPHSVDKLSRFFIHKGDILIAMTGSHANQPSSIVGKVARYDQDEFALLNQRVGKIYSVDEKVLDNNFIYWFFKQWDVTFELAVSAGGSANQANISTAQIKALELELPPILEQRAIAGVLSSLDDKIDLLHRQNSTMEALAETLFRQRFVEEIKEEWEDGTLASIATNVRSSVQAHNIDSVVKYVGLEHIERRSIALINHGFGADVTSNKSAFQEKDILFGKLRPYFHKVCFASFSGVCSTDILVIRAKRQDLSAYCLFAFFQNDVVEYANLGSGGTRMPRTDWKTLSQYAIKVPPPQQLADFNAIVKPALSKIASNIRLVNTLSNLRDTLLPKLMSGEVRVAY